MEISQSYKEYIFSLKREISQSRIKAVLAVNKELILLYWKIGKKILEMQEKEGWGAKIIEQVSNDLRSDFPEMKGLSPTNMHYMRRFALIYKDEQFLQAAPGEITWYHNTTLLDKVKTPEERLWYAQETVANGWSRNVLVMQIESNLYQRQGKAVTNFKDTLPAAQSDLAREIIKSPYNFEFLSIEDQITERKIEKALIDQIRDFMLELGAGFAFVGSQYHLELGGQREA